MTDDFGTGDTYKLYRSVYEIIHPTISKKNISNYKIMIQEDLFPLRIFYPKKISKIEKVIIYVPGKSYLVNGITSYSDVCQEFVSITGLLVIAIDYSFDKKQGYNTVLKKAFDTIQYLYQALVRVGIDKKNIILVGDSIGASIVSQVTMLGQDNPFIEKEILLYPVLDLSLQERDKFPSIEQNSKLDLLTLNHFLKFRDSYVNKMTYRSMFDNNSYSFWPDTLLITGDLDPFRDQGILFSKELKTNHVNIKNINIKFASHGFLNSKDQESKDECFSEIKKFIAKKKGSNN